METVPTGVGATIRRRFHSQREMFYTRDIKGVWRYWDFSNRYKWLDSDEDMIAKTEEPGEFSVVSEGYTPPIPEPKGLGAVVVVDSGYGVETKFVRTEDVPDADGWVEAGDEIWVNWGYISSQPNLRVLSEGV